MWNSSRKFKVPPGDTRVVRAHEYTQAARFARAGAIGMAGGGPIDAFAKFRTPKDDFRARERQTRETAMKLRYSNTSPYVRKVWVSVLEAGLADRIERIEVSPINPDDIISSPNPLGKIPTLITDDGMVLFDSPVIVEYLDGQHDGAKLIPAPGPERWHALRRQALGDGMLENVVAIFVEGMRKPERQSRAWMAHNRASVDRAIDALEDEADALGAAVDIGRIAIAVALAFFDMHFPDEDWRPTHPGLAKWFDVFNARSSMTDTVLVDIRGGK